MIESLLMFLGASLLVASVVLYWVAQKKYAATWTVSRTRSAGVAGGAYRQGKVTTTSLVPCNAPLLAQLTAFSGLALALYLAVFLPFFLSIVLSSPDAPCFSIMVIAAGVASRRSALRTLDGNAPPSETWWLVPLALSMTGGIALLLWGVLRAPMHLQVTLFHVVLPIWAAVQATLIFVSERALRSSE